MQRKIKLRLLELLSVLIIVLEVILIFLFILVLISGKTMYFSLILEWVSGIGMFTLINIYLVLKIKKLKIEINNLNKEDQSKLNYLQIF